MLEEEKALRIEDFCGPQAESANLKTSPSSIHLRYTLPNDLHIVSPKTTHLAIQEVRKCLQDLASNLHYRACDPGQIGPPPE